MASERYWNPSVADSFPSWRRWPFSSENVTVRKPSPARDFPFNPSLIKFKPQRQNAMRLTYFAVDFSARLCLDAPPLTDRALSFHARRRVSCDTAETETKED